MYIFAHIEPVYTLVCDCQCCVYIRGEKKGDDSDSDEEDSEKSKLKSQLEGQRSLCVLLLSQ